MDSDKAAVIVWGFRERCSVSSTERLQQQTTSSQHRTGGHQAGLTLQRISLRILQSHIQQQFNLQQTTSARVSLICRSETLVSLTASSRLCRSSWKELQQPCLLLIRNISLFLWDPSASRQTPDRNLKRICGGFVLHLKNLCVLIPLLLFWMFCSLLYFNPVIFELIISWSSAGTFFRGWV